MNKTTKDGENTFIMYGVSTGETGQYGIGDIVIATHLDWDPVDKTLGDEPVYHVFTVDENGFQYFS